MKQKHAGSSNAAHRRKRKTLFSRPPTWSAVTSYQVTPDVPLMVKLTAKFNSTCQGCEQKIEVGQQFWWRTGVSRCLDCGQPPLVEAETPAVVQRPRTPRKAASTLFKIKYRTRCVSCLCWFSPPAELWYDGTRFRCTRPTCGPNAAIEKYVRNTNPRKKRKRGTHA